MGRITCLFGAGVMQTSPPKKMRSGVGGRFDTLDTFAYVCDSQGADADGISHLPCEAVAVRNVFHFLRKPQMLKRIHFMKQQL